MDGNGNVFVTGFSAGDYTTIKYSILLPISLEIHQLDSEVVLTWTDQAFWLQVAPAINGPFIPIPNAESPYTSSIEGVQSFYRLTSD